MLKEPLWTHAAVLGDVLGAWPVGSRVTCNPPPRDTDEDVLCHVESVQDFVREASRQGFRSTSKCSGQPHFISLRKGDVNLIVSSDKDFVDKFLLATHVCKTLNVMSKQHRIVVFQAILYRNEES